MRWHFIGLMLFTFLQDSSAGTDGSKLALSPMAGILEEASACRRKEIPESLLVQNAPIVRGGIEVDSCLALFPRLSLEPGYVLDFVYDYQGIGGHPILYARLRDEASFSNLEEFRKRYPREHFLGSPDRFDPFYLEKIHADDTADGFLQLAMFVLTAEQFYVFSHALYSVVEPVLNSDTLLAICKVLPEQLRKQAAAIDFQPRVDMGADAVCVEYVVFGEWIGFKRVSWTVHRVFPHKLLKVEEQLLLEHTNPIRF